MWQHVLQAARDTDVPVGTLGTKALCAAGVTYNSARTEMPTCIVSVVAQRLH